MDYAKILGMLKVQSWKSEDWTADEWNTYHQVYELFQMLMYNEEGFEEEKLEEEKEKEKEVLNLDF